MPDPSARGMPDDDVEELVGRLEPLLERLEQATGPVAEVAAQAVEGLALMYGTALARVLALAEETPGLVRSMARDPLLDHLLLLHGLHPRPAAERIRGALDELGAPAELAGVDDGVARVRCSAGGCQAAATERAVRDAVLAAAPELSGVEVVFGSKRPPAVIPVESLLRRPATAAGGGPA